MLPFLAWMLILLVCQQAADVVLRRWLGWYSRPGTAAGMGIALAWFWVVAAIIVRRRRRAWTHALSRALPAALLLWVVSVLITRL